MAKITSGRVGNNTDLMAILTSIVDDLAIIRTALSGHTHGGVTTGADTSAASTTVATLGTTVGEREAADPSDV